MGATVFSGMLWAAVSAALPSAGLLRGEGPEGTVSRWRRGVL